MKIAKQIKAKDTLEFYIFKEAFLGKLGGTADKIIIRPNVIKH